MDKFRLDPQSLVLFTRQLATMINASVSITSSLEVLTFQEHKKFGSVIEAVLKRVNEGHKLSQSLSRYPRIFNSSFITMIQISEATGCLDSCLERLAEWLERDQKLYAKIKGALTYPLFIVALTGLLTGLLVFSVLPGFVKIFQDMHIALPLLTRFVIGVTELAVNPGFWMVAVGSVWTLARTFRSKWKDPVWAAWIVSLLCRIPVLGEALKVAGLVRFCFAMEALLKTGAPLVQALPLGLQCSGDPRLIVVSKLMVSEIVHGQSLGESLKSRPDLFPVSLTGFVMVGEESGILANMFHQMACLLAEELEWRTDALSAALEPVMIGSVSLIVGVVVMSIFLPLYGFIGNLGP